MSLISAEPDVELRAPSIWTGRRRLSQSAITASGLRKREPANQRRFHYQLEPVHAGTHLIRSVAIEFIDQHATSEAKPEPLLIETDPLGNQRLFLPE